MRSRAVMRSRAAAHCAVAPFHSQPLSLRPITGEPLHGHLPVHQRDPGQFAVPRRSTVILTPEPPRCE